MSVVLGLVCLEKQQNATSRSAQNKAMKNADAHHLKDAGVWLSASSNSLQLPLNSP